MQKITINSLVHDLKKIGVKEGDTLLVKVDMVKVGFVKENPKNGLLEALLRSVGPEGTIVISAFTKAYKLRKLTPEKIFTQDSKPNTGLLAEIMCKHPSAVRSTHPTNSFVAIGKQSHAICDTHTPQQSAYQIIQTLADIGSKCILIGCADSNPAPTTAHWAQFLLGQSKKNIAAGRAGVYYIDKNGQKQLFVRKEVGGHNPGAIKLYSHYVKANILFADQVGQAYSILVDTKKCLEVDLAVMRENPKYILCSHPDCYSCRGTWYYNLKDWPMFYLRAVLRKLRIIKKK
jgi:aminoglycoside 3-N-acetyltransferase